MSGANDETAGRWVDRPIGHGLMALWIYVLEYDVGTVSLEAAEPTASALVWPALGIGGVVWLAEASNRVPRPVMNLGGGFLLPIITVVVAIVLTG